MSHHEPTVREIFALLKAGAYDLPTNVPVITDAGRKSRPPKRYGQETGQHLRGSGAVKRPGYDGTDMKYDGPQRPQY